MPSVAPEATDPELGLAEVRAAATARSALSRYEGGEELADRLAAEPGVLRPLLLAVPALYTAFYAVSATLSGAFGTAFNGVEPFDHVLFSPAVQGHDDWRPLVDWLSTVLTLTLVGPWCAMRAARASRTTGRRA